MSDDNAAKRRLSSNKYRLMAGNMRTLADRAGSAETRAEFDRLAALYEKLAERAARGHYAEPDAPPLEPHRGISRMPLQETYFHYDRASVSAQAPSAPGVYALWNRDVWVYVGESSDIRRRLLEHVGSQNDCIANSHPTAFGFELIDDPGERLLRQAALIRGLMPIC